MYGLNVNSSRHGSQLVGRHASVFDRVPFIALDRILTEQLGEFRRGQRTDICDEGLIRLYGPDRSLPHDVIRILQSHLDTTWPEDEKIVHVIDAHLQAQESTSGWCTEFERSRID